VFENRVQGKIFGSKDVVWVFEIRALRRIFGRKRKAQKAAEKCMMENFIIILILLLYY
jgi:hypothetical protein